MMDIEKAYKIAKDQYAQYGVDTDNVIHKLQQIPISIHCWQGDDLCGFEHQNSTLYGGGIQATGNFMGRARTANELRNDLDFALSLIPGKHRINLHAIYAETDGRHVDRDKLEPKHFSGWIDWAKSKRIGMDFNGTFFSHTKAEEGFTLSHNNKNIRNFWIEHGKRCREIGVVIGRELDSPCVTNLWIPDGYKDLPANRKAPRERLRESLDEIFSKELNKKHNLDAVESKLFGIGSETYVVGSHEFYLGYAIKNNILLCLDSGHFHPTEVISDKISSIFSYIDRLLLHVSRGVRWDSDHVVTLTDEIKAIAEELVRGNYLSRIHIGLDFFDASINRVAAWVIGTRNIIKALLVAMLEPYDKLYNFELERDYTSRLALLEELKTLPFGLVWDYYCYKNNVPIGFSWLGEIKRYERDVLVKRL